MNCLIYWGLQKKCQALKPSFKFYMTFKCLISLKQLCFRDIYKFSFLVP